MQLLAEQKLEYFSLLPSTISVASPPISKLCKSHSHVFSIESMPGPLFPLIRKSIVGMHLFFFPECDIGQQHREKQDDQPTDTCDVPFAVEYVVGREVLRKDDPISKGKSQEGSGHQ